MAPCSQEELTKSSACTYSSITSQQDVTKLIMKLPTDNRRSKGPEYTKVGASTLDVSIGTVQRKCRSILELVCTADSGAMREENMSVVVRSTKGEDNSVHKLSDNGRSSGMKRKYGGREGRFKADACVCVVRRRGNAFLLKGEEVCSESHLEKG